MRSRVAIAFVLGWLGCGGKPAPTPPSVHEESPMTPTRDVKEIAARMRRLFADRGLAPAIEETAESFSARLDVSEREIAGGAYIIDRRQDHPPHTFTAEVAGPQGFALDVSMMPMLPQIVTQYVAPPSPRGGILQQFPNATPDGELLSTTVWFAPDADRPSGPYLVIELETGAKLSADFATAVLDRIQPAAAP
jgi:hypothetical protein